MNQLLWLRVAQLTSAPRRAARTLPVMVRKSGWQLASRSGTSHTSRRSQSSTSVGLKRSVTSLEAPGAMVPEVGDRLYKPALQGAVLAACARATSLHEAQLAHASQPAAKAECIMSLAPAST